jgi:6,7-dimethyl-8-ribityllumazine synthase
MSNTPDTLLQTNNLQVYPSQVVVIYTEWNAEIVVSLIEGCKKVLTPFFPKVQIQMLQVPGAVELTHAVKTHWELTRYSQLAPSAYILFGCVIRGDTAHFDYVCQTVTDGVTWLNTHLDVPTIFSVLTVENLQQAKDRIGGSHGHKGEEAAISALRMIEFKHNIVNSLKAK